jgi:hypothetical protein
MSEDRLDKALEAMRNETTNPEQLSDAHVRVGAKLGISSSVCAEFQMEIRDYLHGKLDDKRRLLIEDHLGRCPSCRARLAEQKGEQRVIPMKTRRAAWPSKWGTWAAAAAVLIAALYFGRDDIYSLLALRGPRATVVSATGGLYLVPNRALKTGSTIADNAVIRTGLGSRARLRLLDGSLVDLNEGTELLVHAAWSGKTINLKRGDIIVHAAKQRLSHLRVQTRDSIASVKGTIFAVSAGISGTLVSVVEGSVAVTQSAGDVLLSPGQQAASNPALVDSVQSAISWSPDAESYLAILATIAHIQNQIAKSPSLSLSEQSHLLQYMPDNMVVYGAIPNLGGVASQAASLFEQQATENPLFSQWWNSTASQGLKQLIGKMQMFMPLFGNEIVYGISLSAPGSAVPIFLAEAQLDKQADLTANLEQLRAQMGTKPFYYNLTNSLIAISDSQTHLQWLLEHLRQGAETPFANEIAARYQAGAGSLLGVDLDSIASLTATADAPTRMLNLPQMKHVFFERRDVKGLEENAMTLTFKGPRTGISSFLADAGSVGAAEYITSDAIAAFYIATREPQQMAQELIALFSRLNPNFQANLALAEGKSGISFTNDFARAFGGESAFAVEGISTSGPVWTMACLVNDRSALDNTIRKLTDLANAELVKAGKTDLIKIETETVDGKTWTTMKVPQAPSSITWTYDNDYMVAGSDRGAAMRAIATRSGGSRLIYSDVFQQRLPASLHPAAFVWLNTKSALQGLPVLSQSPVLQKLIAEKDPILVISYGTMEQIRVVSRTRLSDLILNLMLLQGRSRATPQSGSSSTIR